jgi:hypothetical protein
MKFYVLRLVVWLPNAARADKSAKAHKTIFAPNNIPIHTIFSLNFHDKLFKKC